MSLEYEEYHGCEAIRPVMYRVEIVSDTKGFWPFKRTVERQEKVYEARDATWKCPECKSVWGYRGDRRGFGGYWFARRRTLYYVDQNGKTTRTVY